MICCFNLGNIKICSLHPSKTQLGQEETKLYVKKLSHRALSDRLLLLLLFDRLLLLWLDLLLLLLDWLLLLLLLEGQG